MKIFKFYPEKTVDGRNDIHETRTKASAIKEAKVYSEQVKCIVYVDSEYGRLGFVSPPYIDPRGKLIRAKYYTS